MQDVETDYMRNVESASYLAERIRKYWNVRGLSPEVWVEQMASENRNTGPVFVVRSDMVRGLPRG